MIMMIIRKEGLVREHMVGLSLQGTQLLEQEIQAKGEPDPHWGLKISTISCDSETFIYNFACSSC